MNDSDSHLYFKELYVKTLSFHRVMRWRVLFYLFMSEICKIIALNKLVSSDRPKRKKYRKKYLAEILLKIVTSAYMTKHN